MGYVRLTVELMIEESSNYEVVEHHAPLLRDAIINIIGQQPEAKIKSINGRFEIQKLCEEKVKSILQKETGQPLIKKLLFTQWLDN
jgi:flagellar FliL protein